MNNPTCPDCGAKMDYSTEGPTPFFHCPSCHAMIQNLLTDDDLLPEVETRVCPVCGQWLVVRRESGFDRFYDATGLHTCRRR